MGYVEGIVRNVDSNLLACNGGHILITKFWAQSLLSRMGFVKRRCNTKAKWPLRLVQNFDEIKAQFLLDIKTVISFEEIPACSASDKRGFIMYLLGPALWTKKDPNMQVEIVACDDKRQITSMLAGRLHV